MNKVTKYLVCQNAWDLTGACAQEDSRPGPFVYWFFLFPLIQNVNLRAHDHMSVITLSPQVIMNLFVVNV